MGNAIKSPGKKLDRFLNSLSELVDTLPSQEAKSRLDQELKALIQFLQDFRKRLESLPTGEDADGFTSTIETVKDYVRIAESDPVMSRVLGLSSDNRALGKPSRNSLTEQGRKDAKAVAKELKELSSEDVERKLADKKYNIPMLRQIGGELGLNIPSKSTRLSIIEKITKKTANLRGYNYLRHGHNESISGCVSEAEAESGKNRQKQDGIAGFSTSGNNLTDGS